MSVIELPVHKVRSDLGEVTMSLRQGQIYDMTFHRQPFARILPTASVQAMTVLHEPFANSSHCKTCGDKFPCATLRILNGESE